MGYRFRGFFTGWHPEVGEEAARRWPGCTWRPIYEPFLGVGVRCPDTGSATGGANYNQLLELTLRIERELPEFLARFGDLTAVFVEVYCPTGVRCSYGGWVLQSGQLQLLIRLADSYDDEPVPPALPRLLEPLGVRLADDGDFAPLARGFWGEC